MRYKNTVKGRFIRRPNRFIAIVDIDGEETVCHVKNTGRCRELLTENACVILEKSDNPDRKTAYDLIAVYKGERLINMDSQCPNKAVGEFLPKLFENAVLIRPETVWGGSRFDFYIETADGRKIFLEVKGVTLEEDNVAMFPDAPTERGVKHIKELEKCISEGYEGYIMFVIQMSGAEVFMPNDKTHPEFGEALRHAAKNGVKVLAYECNVTEGSMEISFPCRVSQAG
ncbi:MAG: DNA/RNA nuclease SfsA [Huintestinicola sp.]